MLVTPVNSQISLLLESEICAVDTKVNLAQVGIPPRFLWILEILVSFSWKPQR